MACSAIQRPPGRLILVFRVFRHPIGAEVRVILFVVNHLVNNRSQQLPIIVTIQGFSSTRPMNAWVMRGSRYRLRNLKSGVETARRIFLSFGRSFGAYL